jgi:anti-anti-sigma regulatory factor
MLLDMSEAETLDSSGVGWLLECHKKFREAGGGFVIHSLTPTASQVLRMLNMQMVLRLAGDERKALQMLEGD